MVQTSELNWKGCELDVDKHEDVHMPGNVGNEDWQKGHGQGSAKFLIWSLEGSSKLFSSLI